MEAQTNRKVVRVYVNGAEWRAEQERKREAERTEKRKRREEYMGVQQVQRQEALFRAEYNRGRNRRQGKATPTSFGRKWDQLYPSK